MNKHLTLYINIVICSNIVAAFFKKTSFVLCSLYVVSINLFWILFSLQANDITGLSKESHFLKVLAGKISINNNLKKEKKIKQWF